MRTVPAEWSEPTSTRSPMPDEMSSRLRSRKALIRASPSRLSVCTISSSLSRSISTTSPGSRQRMVTRAGRPARVPISPLKAPGSRVPITPPSVTPPPSGRTISRLPVMTT